MTPQEEEDASMATSESDAEAEGIFDGFFDDAMGLNNDVGNSGSGIFYGRTGNVDTLMPGVPRCFTVTTIHLSNTFFPVKYIIDFGTTGCTGPDGHTRRGKITILYTDALIIPGAVATTTFDGFFIDDIKVEGTHKITNTSSSVNTQPISRQFKIDVIDARLTKPNGNYTSWSSHKLVTQIEGILTRDPRDDVFKINGNAEGRIKRGNLLVGWQSEITEPLIRRITCRWIVKGRIRTRKLNNSTNSPWVAILDFGNGNCDNQATIVINGVSHQITLP